VLAAWNRLLTVFGKNAAAAYSLSLHPHTALHYCTMVEKTPNWSDLLETRAKCVLRGQPSFDPAHPFQPI